MQSLPYTPFAALTDKASLYAPAFVGVSAYEFTDWRDETISWKTTCYLHAGLNPTDTIRISGPDVIRFLSKVAATNFDNFPVGKIKHCILTNEKGLIMKDGVAMRNAEDVVTTYWLSPMIEYYLSSEEFKDYDVSFEVLTGRVFLFQIGGPVSLDAVEKACGKSLRDLKFLRFTDGVIAGKNVTIARLGMAGTLSYEVHGAIEDALDVYNALWEAGEPMGMRKLGSHTYPMNHAENGFPQFGVHFLEPLADDPDLMAFLQSTPGMELHILNACGMVLQGSAAGDIRNFYHDPYELGWGKVIKFDHDFIGKDALMKLKEDDKRHMVTLEWNVEDITDVFASQFRDEEPYKYIETPTDLNFWPDFSGKVYHDLVVNDKDEVIGTSFGRQNSAYFHRMISICCLDKEYADLENEVYVLWGNPGTRQKKIRAKVTRFPYNNVLRNESTDVSK